MPEPINDIEICKEHFNRIYDDTFDEVKAYIALKCADPSYVPDILQDTYYEFFRLLYKNGTGYARNARSVLFSIAKRRTFRYYSLKRKLSSLIPLFATNEDGEEYCLADTEGGYTDDGIPDGLEAERIWNIINTYPPDVRKIMYLYFNCGMSHSQIAEKLGCGLSNVKNKLYRTLAEIREREKPQ